MTKNQVHEWHERDEESGKKRYFRGYWNSREWTLAFLEPGGLDWERVEKPEAAIWLALRDVLWRKYQRRRVPFKFVQRVDAILEDMGVSAPRSDEEEVIKEG